MLHPHRMKTKPPPTAANTRARPYVRPTPRAIACARPAASLVPVEVAPEPPKAAVASLPPPPFVVEASEPPVADEPLEDVEAAALSVEELTRVGF